MTPLERLERRTVHVGECWEWQGAHNGDGYGYLRDENGRQWRAHRYAWHHLVAYLHKDQVVHHRCSNRSCWRPEHLQATTAHANNAEMLSRKDLELTIRLTTSELHAVREDFLSVVEDALAIEDERDSLVARLDLALDLVDALSQRNTHPLVTRKSP
jgi:hypothetical protein